MKGNRVRSAQQRRRKILASATAACLFAGFSSVSRADSITLAPSKDNTLFEDNSGSLSNGAGSAFFTGVTASGLRRRGLIAFDLTSLPTNAQPASVQLSLYVDQAAESPAPLTLHKVLKNWGEGTSSSDGMMGGGGGAPATTGDATWLHTFYNTSFWTSPGGDYSSTNSASVSMTAGMTNVIGSTAQMVADVQAWITNPATNFGWESVGDETNFQTAMRIPSRENSIVSERPQLSITYNTSQWKVGSGTWSATTNWNFGVPNAAGAVANFTFASGPAITVTLDAAKTVGTLNINSTSVYTFIGAALTLDAASAPVSINLLQGQAQIANNLNLNKATTFDVAGGASLLVSGTVASSSVSITKADGGTLTVPNIRATALTINGGTVAISTSGSQPIGVSRVGTLNTAGGKFNLTDNHLIVTAAGSTGSWTGSNYTGVTGQIANGRGTSNLWNGSTGIVTTQSNAVGSNFTTIGVARASDVKPATATATTTWAGQTITGTDTLVMYTYGGDATLDGKINVDDYIKIDSGIAAGLTGWSNGDFNYDGKVNIDDYTQFIDANIGTQGPQILTSGSPTAGSASSGSASAVPEPTSILLLALPLLVLPRRAQRMEGRR